MERDQSDQDALEVARGLVANISDPAVLLDTALEFVVCSNSYPEFTGLRRRQLLKRIEAGASPFELLGNSYESSQEYAQLCMSSMRAIHLAEEVVSNTEGQEFTVQLSFLPIVRGDLVVGVLQVFRDVSAEARMQVRYRTLLVQERLRSESLEREVDKRTRELSSALDEVTRLSRVDPLTGLLNRRAFAELAEQALLVAKRHDRSLAILLGDIDYFKKVNDQFGHMVGDQVLGGVAKAIERAVRESDPVARFGGEEFVVLLSETEREAVALVGQRIRDTVKSMPKGGDGDNWPSPTLSLGMAVFPEHGSSIDELIGNADRALYRAKEMGRDRVEMYSKDFDSTTMPGSGFLVRTVLVAGDAKQRDFASVLHPEFRVVQVESEADALELCKSRSFDVLLVDYEQAERGVELLRRSQRYASETLRVLVISSKEVFLEVRGATLARVDSFLLRNEAKDHLRSAIDDGLLRREQDRNRVMMKSDGVRRLFSTRLKELETLIEEEALDFAYQPIVNPITRELVAYEALCRARHPIFRNPQVLFDAAVQSGLLWELGRAARSLSVEALAKMPKGVSLFLNLHPGEVEDPQLQEFAESPAAKRIVFEITERASIPDYDRFRSMIRDLRAKGFRFAIDDLGAGYAGLNSVALLAPDFIKIDMAMVRGIDNAPRRAQLIRRIVDFANDVGIHLIAEGIETAEEAETIANLGCHLAQGYFYGRPGRKID